MFQRHVRLARARRRGGALAISAVAIFMALAVGAAGAQAAQFTISNTTDPTGDPTAFTYHVTFAPQPGDTPPSDMKVPADFTLTGGQSRTFTVHKGFYTVTQLSVSGWRLVNITCGSGGDPVPADAAKIDLTGSKATIELSGTEKKPCTFSNAKVQTPVSPTPSSPPAAGPTPVQQGAAPTQEVLGTQAVRSAAQLAGPRRCVSRRFTVSVTARRVRSVTFFVNGRRLRTLAARPGQRRFSVKVPRPLVTSRVVARVRFRQNTTPSTRTLSTTVRRCAQRAVQPKFTG
jgi:hypothetical protein